MAGPKQDKSEYHSELTAAQIRMARAALGWTWRDLSSAAGVSGDTLARLERGEELRERTLAAVREALEKAGVAFIEDGAVSEGGGPGVRLAKPLKRKRGK
jgi:transcriptional regulator with XRE-family HTH domain